MIDLQQQTFLVRLTKTNRNTPLKLPWATISKDVPDHIDRSIDRSK
jgi:hypothetical protein